MKDFIFGTLATEELRLKHVRGLRAGVSHSYQRFPRDPLPGQGITIKLSVGPGHPCERAWVYWTNDGSEPTGKSGISINGYSTPMIMNGVEWDTTLWGYIRLFEVTLPGQLEDTIIRYYLSAVADDGKEIYADGGTRYACYIADDPAPGWSQDAIIYQIFVDRFFPGKNISWQSPRTLSGFYGGTLKGIQEKLDYLCELGVNTLWLTPIFPSPSHHGYDATDLLDIEPRLGNKADLINLLNDAHKSGIRIILDLAPNHVSNLHPTFQSALTDKNSPYYKWYSFTHWPDKYKSFFDVPELPQLNLSDPSAKQYLLDAAAFWLDRGIDGYRVDYAIGPAADFWADFRRVTRRSNPECWTFGEVVEPPDSQLNFSGSLDGCLDFNLMEAIRITFAYSDWNAKQFSSFLSRHESFFPPSFSRPLFLDNHDMNRFLWAASGDLRKLRQAALCQFTLSGPPIIYYGTEIGLSQIRDVRQEGFGIPEESRLPMTWDSEQNIELFTYYKHLIDVRKKFTQLRHGKAIVVHADKNYLLYKRGEGDEILVAFNITPNKITIESNDGWTNILCETKSGDIQLSENSLTIAPFGGAVLLK